MDYRSEFAEFGDTVYLDVAGQGPLPRVSARALKQALEWKELPHTMPREVYFALPDRVRGLAARLIGGKPGEVAITTGATAGLAAIALGIDWKPGDEVLIAEREFPAHFAVFAPLAQRGWLQIRVVRPRGRYLTAEDFLGHIGRRTRLVTTSLVRFHDGTRLDPLPLAEACHRAGAWLAVDASQAAGAMPIDVREIGADFLVSSGYKWLLSPYGTGFFWVREERKADMQPAPFYWTALPGAHEFNSLNLEPYRPDPSPRRWDAPETASLQLAAVEASLEFLLRVGVATIWQHNRERIRQIIDRLPLDRVVLASPDSADARGPYVCVAARSPVKTRALHQKLRDAGIFVSLRENALRIAPHLFTTPGDIDRLTNLLSI
ncbi:MAG TPA: aminotransferase class V-fold PLP-dependent enzyme [Candidatus Acidoferrales bacterium]|nr:aminotransferase class V-fold PLP-dependent enzyme [Candidatus Acidoferrales bacterium]